MYTISISLTYYLRELHKHFTDEKLVIKHSKDYYVINLIVTHYTCVRNAQSG